MASRHISQREARRLRRRVTELEEQFSALTRTWTQDYVGTFICNEPNATEQARISIKLANRLKFVVLARVMNGNELQFYAVKVGAK